LLILIYRLIRHGRDPAKVKTIAPEFSPPKGPTLAEVGVLIDEKVDLHDLTATIINFALAGFLKIKEEKKSFWHKQDYILIKTKEPDSSFKDHEKMLFDALFDGKKEVNLSKTKESIV